MVEDKTGGAQAMKIVLDEVAGWMSGKFDLQSFLYRHT